MSPPRFYAPQLAQFYNSPQFRSSLDVAEARHAASVLRIRPGQEIELFDGLGHQATARVLSIARHVVEYEVTEWASPVQELTHDLTLAIALPKGDRQKTLVDAATELGVTRLVPLHTERGVAQPTDNALERLSRGVIEACKQSGRNRLMEISDPRPIARLISEHLQTENPEQSGWLKLLAHPYSLDQPSERPPSLHRVLAEQRPCRSVIVIGPEGGLSDEEVRLAVASGWQVVSLGNTILRIEIAALSAAALLTAWLQHDTTTESTF